MSLTDRSTYPATERARHRVRPAVGALITVLLCSIAHSAWAELRFHWEDTFSSAERQSLSAWVADTHHALQQVVGPLKFDIHIYMHRSDGAREPVPWASTRRGRAQGINFHVNPRFPDTDFRRDWTAAHEFSHLALPYLGSRHAWFAEGFASYMQYQVMVAMGTLTPDEAIRRYKRNLRRAETSYPHHSQPFARAAPQLRAEGKYSTMYWGGAAYFLQVEEALRTRDRDGSVLLETLREYVRCCRQRYDELDDLVADLDRLSGGREFSTHLRRFRQRPGFPDYPIITPP